MLKWYITNFCLFVWVVSNTSAANPVLNHTYLIICNVQLENHWEMPLCILFVARSYVKCMLMSFYTFVLYSPLLYIRHYKVCSKRNQTLSYKLYYYNYKIINVFNLQNTLPCFATHPIVFAIILLEYQNSFY